MADEKPRLTDHDLDRLMSDDSGLEQDWGDPGPTALPAAGDTASRDAQSAFGPPPPVSDGAARPLDFILDIPLEISVELGRTKMIINDLLQLGQGSVIELSKLAGEPLEIYVNDKLVARGEVVVVNEKFGVRVTDIVSPMERVKSLA
ncbi:MAG: flagellar motor switch protein FliN [Deltaproteobacteria bacterium]|jgi:flagellar motor switch protein FliN/FliY|nr:flagellar motor switch protein FliN [Deltaproteobacteria bacterium]